MNFKFNLFVLIILAAMYTSFTAHAETGDIHQHYSAPNPEKLTSWGGDILRIPGACFPEHPGEPDLPAVNRLIEIPGESTVDGIIIDRIEWESLSGQLNPRPQPKPQILSLSIRDEKVGISSVYDSDDYYPLNPVKFIGTNRQDDCTIAEIIIYPYRFHPQSKQMDRIKRIEYHLQTQSHPIQSNKTLIQNRDEPVEYLIITDSSFSAAFQPLIDWKNKKGISAAIETVQNITAVYPGRDDQEKIRNFLMEKQPLWNIEYVLIGGDVDYVPIRECFAFDCEAGMHSDENDLGADLYYADLDGDWDADGDDLFGELADNVDLGPDLSIGRFPAESVADVTGFVNKVLSYEQNPPSDYLDRALFYAMILWGNPYTDSSIHKDAMDTDIFPPEFDPIIKLYESLGNESDTAVLAALNDGGHFANHNGHGWYSLMSTGNGSLDRSEIDTLTNGNKNWIHYSIGCWTNALDFDAIAEHLIDNPDGGAIAVIGNYRYGWGSPGNPGFGYSEVYDTKFFELLFESEYPRIGDVFAETKAYFIPQSRGPNVYRWHQYQLNLLGDPEMPVWMDEPVAMFVEHPALIAQTETVLPVWVSRDGNGISSAQICLSKNSQILATAITNSSGYAQLNYPPQPTGSLDIVVTGKDKLPYISTISVGDGPDLRVDDMALMDDGSGSSVGNGNGIAEAGETLEIWPQLRNLGNENALDISASLSTSHPDVSISSSTAGYSDIGAGDIAQNSIPFLVEIAGSFSGNETAMFTLDLTGSNYSGQAVFSMMIGEPSLMLDSYVIYDYSPDGDEDMVPESGETFYLNLVLSNYGEGYLHNPTLHLASLSPDVSVIENDPNYPNIGPGESYGGYELFELSIDSGAPVSGWSAELELTVTPLSGDAVQIVFKIPVGETDFYDDMESGEVNWTHGGVNDLWQITDNRCSSATHSMYLGSVPGYQYPDNTDAWLTSGWFMVGSDPVLSLDRWYEFTTFGSDGIFVEVDGGSGFDQLAYIGSGGALLNISDDWAALAFDLPYEHQEIRLRFNFVSDGSDHAEGAYLDDITVISYNGSAWGSEPDLPPPETPTPTATPGESIPATSPAGLVILLLLTGLMVCISQLRPIRTRCR